MVKVLVSDNNPTCPDTDNLDIINYWCTALSNFKGGFDLIFERPITDIAWIILRPSLDIDAVLWIIEDSGGLEEYFDATVLTPGCNTPGIVILVPREARKLAELYKPQILSLGSITCNTPSKESFNAWINVVEGLIRNIGPPEELTRHAMRVLGQAPEHTHAMQRAHG